MSEKKKEQAPEEIMSPTNGEKHNLMPDEDSWLLDAKDDMEEYIEQNGVHIRQ